MKPTDLYAQIMGIRPPWQVTDVKLRRDESELLVFAELLPGVEVVCPECGATARRYDHRERRLPGGSEWMRRRFRNDTST